MAEQAQKPQQVNPPQQEKPFDKQKLAAELSAMMDPKQRFVVIDSESFSVMIVGILQIKDSELSTALLRRRQDFATNE